MINDLDSTLNKIEQKFNQKISTNIHIAANLLPEIKTSLTTQKILIISDSQIVTNNKEFFKELKQTLNAKSYILSNPKCNIATANDISAFVNNVDLILGFGSGTINDLCKYVAYQKNIDYAIIGTAFSMNGYLSKNVSISINNHKKSVNGLAPIHAFFDLNILKNSPKRLTCSGIFDVICAYLIENDWLLSNLVGIDDEYDPFYLEIQKPYLEDLAKNFTKVMDHQDPMPLLNLLLITGLLMNFNKSSKPASQAEHLIAHLLDMRNSFNADYFHGEQVLVGTVLSFQIQSLISNHINDLTIKPRANIYFEEVFPIQYANSCRIEYNQKANSIKHNKNLQNISDNYIIILPTIQKNLNYTKKFFTLISNCNISLKPRDYVINENETEFCLNNACLIRNRFTHLDLLFHGKIKQ
jgi:glycerol-1-phosphate dehydrogenase [NAD(P)+]